MIKAYAPQYVKFSENDGTAYGAYGCRLAKNIEGRDMLDAVLYRLAKQPDTRQAVIALWRPDDLCAEGRRDLPCTLTWQFIQRLDELHLVVSMRSNDVWLGMPYDIYVNTCIQRLVANTMGLRAGDYVHHVGSLHLYERNRRAAQEAYDLRELSRAQTAELTSGDKLDKTGIAVCCEAEVRAGRRPELTEELGQFLYDTVMCCASKWDASYSACINDKALTL